MLSENERMGIIAILQDIEDDDLFSILETVTKRMFVSRNRQEAVKKILSCIEKPSDLLRRQKLTKKILFNYLLKRGVVVLAVWGKADLVKKCLELWGSTESCKDTDYIEVETQNTVHVTTEMGIQFTKWFFRILNALDGFGSEHFWPGCMLTAELLTPYDHKEVSLSGASNVASFLANLILMDKYHFHANESKDSIMLEVEKHGLIKILIQGVLHQLSNCVGLFDCAFGLIENPEHKNTYKIQILKVKMQVRNPVQGSLPSNNVLPICQSVS